MAKASAAVQEAFRFALDPTPRQERRFLSHAGGARYAYNWGIAQIAAALDAYQAEKAAGVEKPTTKIPTHFDLCKQWTQYKDDPANGLGWVGENFVGTYQAALRDAAAAWKAFFDSRTGKRKGRRVGRPRFKSRKKDRPAFQLHGTVRMESATRIRLPKIGSVRVLSDHDWRWRDGHKGCADAERNRRRSRQLWDLTAAGQARIVRATISREPDGLWFASVTVELTGAAAAAARPERPTRRQQRGGTIGLDLGVKYLAVASTGQVWANPRPYQAVLDQLRHAQRALSRTQDGSRRRERARRRVAVLHARVRRARRGAMIRAVSQITREYEHIVVEGWDVQRVMQHGTPDAPRRVRAARNRALADSACGGFRARLQLAAPRVGSKVTVLDAHTPTGRTCSACGQVRAKPVPPAEELFSCPACGYTAPRRLNTARVLVRLATQAAPQGVEPRGGDVRPVTPRRGGRSPVKRAARARSSVRGKTGTPGP